MAKPIFLLLTLVAMAGFLWRLDLQHHKTSRESGTDARPPERSASGSAPVPAYNKTTDRDHEITGTASSEWLYWREPLRKPPGEWTAAQAWSFWSEAAARITPDAANAIYRRGEKEARLIAAALLIASGNRDREMIELAKEEGDLDVLAEIASRLFVSNQFEAWRRFVDTALSRTTQEQFATWRQTYLENPHGPDLSPLLVLLDFGRGRDFFLIEMLRRQPAWMDVWLEDVASQPLIQAGRLRLLAGQVSLPVNRPSIPPDNAELTHIALWEDWLESADRSQPAGLDPPVLELLMNQDAAGAAYADHARRYRRALLAYHAEGVP